MNQVPLAILIVSSLGIIISIILFVNSSVDNKIEMKLNDPNFIKKVASEVRLPFLIFDEDKRYLVDTGAAKLIEDIEIIKGGRSIEKIIITTKEYLSIAPILESYDGEIKFQEPQKGEKFKWIYKTILPEVVWATRYEGGIPKKQFKLQIIELSHS